MRNWIPTPCSITILLRFVSFYSLTILASLYLQEGRIRLPLKRKAHGTSHYLFSLVQSINTMVKLILFISILFTAGTVFIVFYLMRTEVNTKYKDHIYTADTVPAGKVCLVPGAQIWGDRPSHVLEDRLLVGIELYRKGKVEKLLLSGDHGYTSYDEVNVMKDFVLSQSVNEHDIFMDHAGFRTYDSCYRARDVFGIKKLIIVTNSFHLPRALYIASELGLDACGVPSDLRVYSSEGKGRFREFFAQVKAFLDIRIFKPLPRYLGPKIDINGSGVVTQD